MIETSLGTILAFIAMIFWGVGDFFIQKSTRRVGDIESLFVVSLFGFVIVSPFVAEPIGELMSSGFGQGIAIIAGASLVLFIAAMLQFEALRRGKISVVEPTWALEIPAAALLAFLILGERISFLQIVLTAMLMISVIFTGLRTQKLSLRWFFEKGVFFAAISGVISGMANFFAGWGGRVSEPLLMNFSYHGIIMICSFLIILLQRRLKKLVSDVRQSWRVLLPMAVFDTVAWIAFVFSMTLIPIAVATALSESYIIIAVLLGLFVGKEKLERHQKWGLVGALISVICLASITI